MNRELLPLFSTPISISQNKDMAEQYYPAIRDLEYSRMAANGWLSKDSYVLEQKCFKPLKDYIQSCIHYYIHEDLSYQDDVEFYINNSWATIHNKNDYASQHDHTNSLISGTFYINIPEDDQSVFSLHSNNSSVFPRAFNLNEKEFNLYNAQQYSIKPSTGTTILFPSHVVHSTSAQTSEENRYCLAFNTFIRGTLADKFSNINTLHIK